MIKRAVLVGCGSMAANWMTALAHNDVVGRVHLVGLVDTDLNAAEALKAKFCSDDVSVSDKLDDLLEDLKPDMVFDVAVPEARRKIIETAFAHGCDVLTEKPMATNVEDARSISALAAEKGRVHAVTQNRRFKQGIRRAQNFIASGALGRISALHCDFFIGAHFGGFRDEMDHVLLLDMSIHTFDAARFISSQEPRAVYCHETNPAGSWYAQGAAADAIFNFSNDVTFTYRGSWCAEGADTNWDSSWRIIGEKGTLCWDGEDGFKARVVDGDEGFFRPLREMPVPAAPNEELTREHTSVIAEFLDAIETGRAPETGSKDNIKSLAMVFGAIESARTRQRVEITV